MIKDGDIVVCRAKWLSPLLSMVLFGDFTPREYAWVPWTNDLVMTQRFMTFLVLSVHIRQTLGEQVYELKTDKDLFVCLTDLERTYVDMTVFG